MANKIPCRLISPNVHFRKGTIMVHTDKEDLAIFTTKTPATRPSCFLFKLISILETSRLAFSTLILFLARHLTTASYLAMNQIYPLSD